MEKQKQSLYFPEDTLREITREATRLDRSLSWTVQQAWRLAREEVRKFPPADRGAGPERSATPEHARPADPHLPGDDGDQIRASAQVQEFLRGKFDHDLAS